MKRSLIVALVVATAVIQVSLWLLESRGLIARVPASAIRVGLLWGLIAVLAFNASRRISGLQTNLQIQRDRHQATLSQIEQLAALNDMLLALGRSNDVGLAFQSLAGRIGRLVPCDRMGLALLRETSQEVLTYTARVSEPERRRRPRPELELSLERSIFGRVIRTCDALLLDDLAHHAADFHDASVLASQGLHSALVVPLVSRNRAIGALMVVSRLRAAFTSAHRDALQPLAEVLAVAFVAQRQHHALEKFQMMESMSEKTFALASEVNGALQGVIGEASILRREHPDLGPGLDEIVRHAERTLVLLERMRAAAHDRLGEGDLTASIPASPEAFGDDEGYG